jgi:hypothetical protein
MDSLKTLMDKKDYELVLKLTESSRIANDLFYRIASFTALNKPEEALKVINDNKSILETELPVLMKMHIELLVNLDRYDEAKSELEGYEELPYFSQVAEEQFISLKKYISEAEKNHIKGNNFISDDQIRSYLASKDDELILAGLQSLKDKDLRNYISSLIPLLVGDTKQSIKSLALMTLVDKKWDHPVKFFHNDAIIEVVPRDLTPPFVNDDFKNVIVRMSNKYKDPVVLNNAIELLSTYIIYNYPTQLDIDNDEMVEALFELVTKYLSIKNKKTLDERCFEQNLDLDIIKKNISDIEKSVSSL